MEVCKVPLMIETLIDAEPKHDERRREAGRQRRRRISAIVTDVM